VLGIDIYEVKGPRVPGKRSFYAAQEAAKDGQLKGVKEEGQGRHGRERVLQGVGVVDGDGCKLGGVGAALPDFGVGECDVGECAVELDALDTEKRVARGEQRSATFAGADIEEDRLFDGSGEVQALQPEIEQGLKDAGGDAVVGRELGGFYGGAASDGVSGDEAGGVRAVELVEGVNDGL